MKRVRARGKQFPTRRRRSDDSNDARSVESSIITFRQVRIMTSYARTSVLLTGRTVLAAVGLLMCSGCASVAPKTPVRGEPVALARLHGDWEGTYESTDSDRSGVISFRLRAGTDTAQGEVLMTPHVRSTYSTPDIPVTSRFEQHVVRALTIRFVYVEDDEVLGLLDPYDDPVCGCTLTTRFRGRISADVIEGSYRSDFSNDLYRHQTGKWRVQRRIVAN